MGIQPPIKELLNPNLMIKRRRYWTWQTSFQILNSPTIFSCLMRKRGSYIRAMEKDLPLSCRQGFRPYLMAAKIMFFRLIINKKSRYTPFNRIVR